MTPEAVGPAPSIELTPSAVIYRARVVLVCLAVFALMSILAPREFPTWGNFENILRATSTDALAAAGFTLVMLTGNLDLSIGSSMTMGGTVVMLAQPIFGWPGAFFLAGAVGCLIGLFNGFLVARVKINSFIVTLGTMTILHGLTRRLLEGGSKSLDDVAAGMRMVEWLNSVWPWSPRVLLIFLPILLIEIILRRTRAGRNVFLIGGNRQAAWYAGILTDRTIVGAFLVSGFLSALGGALAAAAQNTAMPNLGDKSLMLVVAAVIVGGTSMAGGRGSVVMSIIALLALNALTNGLGYLGASKSVKLIANGMMLSAVIVYDAWRAVAMEKVRGQRRELLRELDLAARGAPGDAEESEVFGVGSEPMQGKDRTFAIVCVTAIACVAIVAIFAMYLRSQSGVVSYPGGQGGVGIRGQPDDLDVLSFRATDGQPLVWIDDSPLEPPERPESPGDLPQDHLLRWYDYEYSGWKMKKLPQPPSPGDGPRGKKVVSLQYMDHPYWTGYQNGMQRLADAYGMRLTIMEAGNDNKVQMDQVEQAIHIKPDLVIITPVDSNGAVPMLRRLYEEKVPVIASNLIPVDEGMKYVITWTGPDDWGQFRMLAREFARAMNNQGSYCVIRHIAGTSCYLSRTWSLVSELKKVAPQMTCLDMQSTDLKTEETKTQVAAWLKKYGEELKGIASADDSKAQVGIVEALKDAGREDIICVAAGSSRTGLNYIQAGKLHAVTYQSAEADGALPIKIAADWFSGKKIERPIYYIKKQIITRKNVDEFLPAQW